MVLKKKGSYGADTILIVVVLFLLVIGGMLIYQILGDVNTEIQADTSINESSKAQLDHFYNAMPSWLDGIFAVVLVLGWMGMIIASFYLDTHPIFFAISLVITILVLLVGAYMSNFYDDFINSPGIAGAEDSFPIMNWTMQNFVTVVLVMLASVAIALYGKNRLQQ